MQTSMKPYNIEDLERGFFKRLVIQGKSINTVKNYRTDLECFKSFLLTDAGTVETFGPSQVNQYGSYLLNRYASDNSRRRRIQTLRIFFDYLVEERLFPNNPVRKLLTAPKFLDIPRPAPFSEIKTLWNFLLLQEKSDNEMTSLLALRNQIIFLLIYGAGLKVSDLASLATDQVMRGTEGMRVMITVPKRDPYTIPLPKSFTKVYDKYEELLHQKKKESGLTFDDLLFNANPYKILAGGLSPRGLEITFEEWRKKLLLSVTPKSLRQACIFKWLTAKKKEGQIKEWLGVAPSYTLKLYRTHATDHIYNETFL